MVLKPPVKLNFSRFEYKYLLPAFIAESIITRVAALMRPDFFNSSGPYIVRSLYFDSPNLQFYREKIEGDFVRKKVRLRSYGEDLKEPVYFEVKNKLADRIYKDRFLNQLSYKFFIIRNRLLSKYSHFKIKNIKFALKYETKIKK